MQKFSGQAGLANPNFAAEHHELGLTAHGAGITSCTSFLVLVAAARQTGSQKGNGSVRQAQLGRGEFGV